jgi:hypothetical protein
MGAFSCNLVKYIVEEIKKWTVKMRVAVKDSDYFIRDPASD